MTQRKLSSDNQASFKLKIAAIGVLVALVVGVGVLAMAVAPVDEGEVGVVTHWGEATGEIHDPGMNYHLPNPVAQSHQTIETRPVAVDMDGEDDIFVITQDGQDVWVELTVRYRVDDPQTFFTEYRNHDQAQERLIDPTVRSNARDEASDLSAREIITRDGRLSLEGEIENALRENSQGSGVSIEAVQVRSVTLNDEFATTLEEVEIEETRAEQRLVEAEGIAEAEVAEAEGYAEAMEKRDAALTEAILQFEQIQAYDDGTVYVTDGNQQIILDESDD